MATPSVIVFCRMRNGLTIQVDDKRVRLRGSACYIQPNPNRKFKPTDEKDVVYGATMNLVAKDFWEEWKKRVTKGGTEKFDLLEKGLIYAHENKGDGAAHSRDMENEKHGTEQLDPKDKKNGVKQLNDREEPVE